MNNQQNSRLNVVHEAIDERQHVRANVPSKVNLTINGKRVTCALADISLGGMSVFYDEPLEEGLIIPVEIEFKLTNFDLSIEAKVKVVSQKTDTTGFSFIDIEKKKSDTLRHIISSYISGDMVNVSGVLNVVQRENHIKQRKTKLDTTRSLGERIKAILGTFVYFVAGLAIFSLLASKLYLYFFQIEASNAFVSADTYAVNMPENGYISYLLNSELGEVSVGEPIASVSTQLMTRFTTPDDIRALSEISQQDLQTLFGKALIETVLTSPCDCYIAYAAEPMDRYAYKEQLLLNLIPKNQNMYIKASFPFSKIDKLENISRVKVRVFGADKAINASVIRSELDNVNNALVLIVQPDIPLSKDDFQKPASVLIDTGIFSLNVQNELNFGQKPIAQL